MESPKLELTMVHWPDRILERNESAEMIAMHNTQERSMSRKNLNKRRETQNYAHFDFFSLNFSTGKMAP